MKSDIERGYTAAKVEFRAAAEGEKSVGMLVGYAAMFDKLSEDMGGFREVIRPGAFDRVLKEEQDVMARAEHSAAMLLGRRSSGTLRLSVDEQGLRYEIDVPNTGPGRDLVTLIERGDVSRSSFAFRVKKDGQRWSTQDGGAELRELTDIHQLVDVAPVADPAYRDTAVALRALEEARAGAVPLGVPNEINAARLRMQEE